MLDTMDGEVEPDDEVEDDIRRPTILGNANIADFGLHSSRCGGALEGQPALNGFRRYRR
jgi:hypothetical protein